MATVIVRAKKALDIYVSEISIASLNEQGLVLEDLQTPNLEWQLISRLNKLSTSMLKRNVVSFGFSRNRLLNIDLNFALPLNCFYANVL